MKRTAFTAIGLVLVWSAFGLMAGAQSQPAASAQSTVSSSNSGSSLGDYARQIRKDSADKSKPKVFDNDNLPTNDKLSIVGSTQTPTTDNSSGADTTNSSSTENKTSESKGDGDNNKSGAERAAAKPAPPATLPEDEAARQAAIKEWSDKIADQQQQIDLAERELNILQREYQLRAAAMYGDVGNRLRDSTDWDKQDAQYKQQIADKQKALDDLRQQLNDSQENARKAGVPESQRGAQ